MYLKQNGYRIWSHTLYMFLYLLLSIEKIHRHSLTYHVYYFCLFYQQKSNGHDMLVLGEPFQYHVLFQPVLALWLLPIKTRQNKTKTEPQKTYPFTWSLSPSARRQAVTGSRTSFRMAGRS